jgi:hypothetical protein
MAVAQEEKELAVDATFFEAPGVQSIYFKTFHLQRFSSSCS